MRRWCRERRRFCDKVAAIMAAHSPDLVQRAHDLVNAPPIFGMEIGFNLPAFLIALVITAILVVGIKESARFNATIVVIKVAVVLFVHRAGLAIRVPRQLGASTGIRSRPMGFRRHWGRGGLHLFRVYRIRCGVDHGAGSEESAARFADWHHRFAAGLHGALHRGGGCSDRHGALAGQSILKLRLRERSWTAGLTTASHIITLGALAGLTSVMLVMLLGQTRVLYAMANDGLLPKKFFAAMHPKFRTPYKNTILVGLLAAIVGSVTPIDDIGKMVNIGTLLAFVIVCIAVMVLRRTNPEQARPFRTPLGSGGADPGDYVQRLHDVQAGLDELGPADRLAGDRLGDLFCIQPAPQPGK